MAGHRRKFPVAIQKVRELEEEQKREKQEEKERQKRETERQEKLAEELAHIKGQQTLEAAKSQCMRGTASQEEGSSKTDREPTTANSNRDGRIALTVTEDKR